MARKLHYRPLGFDPTTFRPTLTPKPLTIWAACPTTPPPSTIHPLVSSLEPCVIWWSALGLTLTIYRMLHYPPLAGFVARQRLDRRFHLASTHRATLSACSGVPARTRRYSVAVVVASSSPPTGAATCLSVTLEPSLCLDGRGRGLRDTGGYICVSER